ncbi:MFS transporter, partial [Amycolatopsis rhizosphaerae]
PAPVPFRDRFTPVQDPRVVVVLFATTVCCVASFSVYTFISPVLAATAGLHGTAVSLLLFCYGAGGAAGNVLGGRAVDRWGSRPPLMAVITLAVVVLAVLPLVARNVTGAAIVLFLWGMSTWAFNPPVQHRLIELAPHTSGLLLSLNASAIYLGVGLAGVVGGFVLTAGGPGVLPEFSSLLDVLGLLAVGFAWQRRQVGSRGATTSQSEPGKMSPSCPSANLTR